MEAKTCTKRIPLSPIKNKRFTWPQTYIARFGTQRLEELIRRRIQISSRRRFGRLLNSPQTNIDSRRSPRAISAITSARCARRRIRTHLYGCSSCFYHTGRNTQHWICSNNHKNQPSESSNGSVPCMRTYSLRWVPPTLARLWVYGKV